MDSILNFNSLIFLQKLEKSKRSSADLYQNPQTDRKYVVKYLPTMYDSSIDKEYNILSSISHPNIIKAHLTSKNGKKILITEFMDMGDLLKFLEHYYPKLICLPKLKSFQNQENFWRSIFIQVLRALIFLKDLNLAHCDIKPENIVLNSDFEAKLIDFEFAFKTKKPDSEMFVMCDIACGSPSYLAPEIKEKKIPYNPYCSDIFSLGTTFINLILGKDVFNEDNLTGITGMKWVKNGNFSEMWNHYDQNNLMTKALKDMFEKMFAYKCEDRINLNQLINHEWFKGIIWSKDEMKNYLFKKTKLN